MLAEVRQSEALTAFAAVLSAKELDRIEELDDVRTAAWEQRADLVRRELAELVSTSSSIMATFTTDVLSLDLSDIHRQAQAAQDSGFFGRKGRLKAAASRLSGVLKPGEPLDLKHLTDVTGRLASLGRSANELRSRIDGLSGVRLIDGWNPLLPAHREWLEQRILWLNWSAALVDPDASADRAEFVGALRRLYEARPAIAQSTIDKVSVVSGALQTLVAEAAVLPEDLLTWSGDPGLIAQWRDTSLARRLQDESGATLRAWCELLDVLEPLRREELLEARRALLTGAVPAEDAVRAFAAGVAVASRQERAVSTGLDPFDDQAHERRIRHFVEASAAIRDHLVSIIPQDVVRSRSFDPSPAGRIGRWVVS
ncbi:MAG: hypothetical protein R2845_10610 [Thermomicrobiales bacterium]